MLYSAPQLMRHYVVTNCWRMDNSGVRWYYWDMSSQISDPDRIPAWNLYGEDRAFPDVLHCERITDRAAGLDWVIAPHRHPHLHQFFLIRSGSVEMSADGERLVPDLPCIFTIPRGTVHGFKFSADTDGYVVTIPLQNLPDIFDPQSLISGALSRFALISADDEIIELFEGLHIEHDGSHSARTTMLKAKASVMACEVLRRLPKSEQMVRNGPDPRFQQFEEMVRVRFREGWQLKDYAHALHLSSRHLGRLCKKATGQSPTEYVEAVSMREACRLLVYTRDSIAAIGYQLGFEDPSYFSRAFRRNTGSTPRDYRAAFEQE